MADERTWQFEMTRDRVPELQHKLEWALQHQNRRFADSVERIAHGHPIAASMDRVVPLLFRILGGFGLALLATALAVDPTHGRGQLSWMIPAGVLFVAVIVIAPFVPRIRARLRGRRIGLRWAGRSIARDAESTYRRVAAKAPYTIDYRLTADALEVRAPAIRVVRRFELRRARRVLDGGEVLFVFRRHGSLRPSRYIYVATPADHDAVIAALTAAGATVETLTGPVDGYVASVPEARVHSD